MVSPMRRPFIIFSTPEAEKSAVLEPLTIKTPFDDEPEIEPTPTTDAPTPAQEE